MKTQADCWRALLEGEALPRWYDQILEGGVLCWVWAYDQNRYRYQPLTRAGLQTLLENVPEV